MDKKKLLIVTVVSYYEEQVLKLFKEANISFITDKNLFSGGNVSGYFRKCLFPPEISLFHPINIHSPSESCIVFSFSKLSHWVNQQKSYFKSCLPWWMQFYSVETPILCGRFDFHELQHFSTSENARKAYLCWFCLQLFQI